jgi:hypothetical protein
VSIRYEPLAYYDGSGDADPHAGAVRMANAAVKNLLEQFRFDYRVRQALFDGAQTGDYCAHFYFDPAAKPYGGFLGAEAGEKLPIVGLHLLQVQGIVTAQSHVRVLEEPGGQAAKIPFGADVGAGTDDDVEIQLFRSFNKALDVQNACEIELPFSTLVEVPAGVGLHGVEAAGLELLEAILPALGEGAEVVDGTRQDGVGLAVQIEATVAVGEVFFHGDAPLMLRRNSN